MPAQAIGNMKNKNIIIISLILVILIGGVIFGISKTNTSPETTAAKKLIPAREITHGHGLSVDVKDPKKLYIATHHGLYVLIDDKNIYQLGENNNDYMGFSPNANNSKVFFASGHPEAGGNIGFQKSEDGGFSWKQISDGVDGPVDFHSMSVSPKNPNLIFGWFKGNIQRSADGGLNWKVYPTKFFATSLIADTTNENIVYATTPQGPGVMVSRDKGENWSLLSEELQGGIVSTLAIDPKDSQKLLVFSEKLGGLGKSIDGGKTWQKINELFNKEEILYLAISRSDPNIVYALTHMNSIYKSLDGGSSWKKIR